RMPDAQGNPDCWDVGRRPESVRDGLLAPREAVRIEGADLLRFAGAMRRRRPENGLGWKPFPSVSGAAPSPELLRGRGDELRKFPATVRQRPGRRRLQMQIQGGHSVRVISLRAFLLADHSCW